MRITFGDYRKKMKEEEKKHIAGMYLKNLLITGTKCFQLKKSRPDTKTRGGKKKKGTVIMNMTFFLSQVTNDPHKYA